MSGRLVAVLCALIAAAAGAPWFHRQERAPDSEIPALRAGRYYAVAPSATGTIFDLDMEAGTTCDVIISSLGDSSRAYRVQLSSNAVGHPTLVPITLVNPLRARRTGNSKGITPGADESAAGGQFSREMADAVPARQFLLHVANTDLEDPRGYTAVEARVVAEGKQVRVYLDRQISAGHLADGLADEIHRLMDDEIIPRSGQILGCHSDIDHDGKLAILLTGWLGRLANGQTSVNGFVRSNDFQSGLPAPFSNHADVLYLNASLPRGPELKALLAHEYTHAVCFSLRRTGSGHRIALPDEEDWINEGIAHVAEMLHGCGWSNLDHRIDRFLAAPWAAPLVVPDYYRAGLWRDAGCRGTTFLWLRWCVDTFGEGLLRELVEGPAHGTKNVELATGIPFDELFRQWTIALASERLPSLDLRGRIGDYDLAGPARIDWNLDATAPELEIRGTACAFVRLCAPLGGSRRVVISTDSDARLQVTLSRTTPHPRRPSFSASTAWMNPQSRQATVLRR